MTSPQAIIIAAALVALAIFFSTPQNAPILKKYGADCAYFLLCAHSQRCFRRDVFLQNRFPGICGFWGPPPAGSPYARYALQDARN